VLTSQNKIQFLKAFEYISVKEHKNIKGLKNQNLCDHMNEVELIFTALAELSTRVR